MTATNPDGAGRGSGPAVLIGVGLAGVLAGMAILAWGRRDEPSPRPPQTAASPEAGALPPGNTGVPETGRPAKVEDDDAEVTLDVLNRPLKEVIAVLQTKTRTNLMLAKNAEEIPVKVKVRLPWRQALGVVRDVAPIEVEEQSPHVITIEKQPRVTFDFQNADIRVVIRAIADIGGANIVVGGELEGTVTLTLNDMPWRRALDSIVESKGFKAVKDKNGVVIVGSAANLPPAPEYPRPLPPSPK